MIKRNKYLMQKLELMDMKLKEAQEREESIERLHNTMLKALKDDDLTAKKADFVKEYEYLSEMHRKEMDQVVENYKTKIQSLEEKNRSLQDKIAMISKLWFASILIILLTINLILPIYRLN